jgi:hypothetical protein
MSVISCACQDYFWIDPPMYIPRACIHIWKPSTKTSLPGNSCSTWYSTEDPCWPGDPFKAPSLQQEIQKVERGFSMGDSTLSTTAYLLHFFWSFSFLFCLVLLNPSWRQCPLSLCAWPETKTEALPGRPPMYIPRACILFALDNIKQSFQTTVVPHGTPPRIRCWPWHWPPLSSLHLQQSSKG